MKTSSWEIVIAGFIFIGLSIYLIEQNSETSAPNEKAAAADSIEITSSARSFFDKFLTPSSKGLPSPGSSAP